MPQALQAGKGATTVPKWLPRAIAALAGLVLVALLAGLSGLLTGRPPGDLGVRDGRLYGPQPASSYWYFIQDARADSALDSAQAVPAASR